MTGDPMTGDAMTGGSTTAVPTSGVPASAACRGCGGHDLVRVLDLGETPLANALLTNDALDAPEARFPLDLAICPACSLVQITTSVPPERLFADYAYFSSYVPGVVANAEELAKQVLEERQLGPDNLVMEIASNDGYLLRHYVDAGVPVLGIDPAANIAEVAEQNGVPTVCDFFGDAVATRLRAEGRRADVIHANNVLAHVPDPNGVVRGIELVLADNGVAIIETPYVRDLVEDVEFDTIYHEHLFYYSLTSLQHLFERNGLELVEVSHIPIHGGSLRVTAGLAGRAQPSAAVTQLLADEAAIGLTAAPYYQDFAARVDRLCESLRALVQDLHADGKRVACYGAAAKGATMLNTLKLPAEVFDFVVDRSPVKQGRYMPGVHLEIVSPERLLESMPDYLLLLAWNFAEEIMEQQAEYARKGGRFIVPVPEPVVH
ncbi:MAG TPA: class I SAM-dependent methyltransferase [Acidimicrobiales bacterium]